MDVCIYVCTPVCVKTIQIIVISLQVMIHVVANLSTPVFVDPTPKPNNVFNVFRGSTFSTSVFAQSSTPNVSSPEFKQVLSTLIVS